jgi:hypothetical protein
MVLAQCPEQVWSEIPLGVALCDRSPVAEDPPTVALGHADECPSALSQSTEATTGRAGNNSCVLLWLCRRQHGSTGYGRNDACRAPESGANIAHGAPTMGTHILIREESRRIFPCFLHDYIESRWLSAGDSYMYSVHSW